MGIPVPPKKKFPYGLVAAGVLLAGLGFAVVKVIVEPMGNPERWPVDIIKAMPPPKIGLIFAGGLAIAAGFAAVTSFVVEPLKDIDAEKWQNVQKKTRAGVIQEEVQPGGMRVWSNPFEEKKEK